MGEVATLVQPQRANSNPMQPIYPKFLRLRGNHVAKAGAVLEKLNILTMLLRPQRDSNPRSWLEGPLSWAGLDDGVRRAVIYRERFGRAQGRDGVGGRELTSLNLNA